jgi:hypothetical protein
VPDAPPPDHHPGDLADRLADVGRQVRDAVRGTRTADDGRVVRTEGGDDVFGVDARADRVLIDGLHALGVAGTAIVEGHGHPIALEGPPEPRGPWRILVDPVDGTRPYLAGKRSAWVLIGAGRRARTLEDLEVGVMVEIPTERAAWGAVMAATIDGRLTIVDDDLVGAGPSRPREAAPREGDDLHRAFVTVVRFAPGEHGPIGAWADHHLAGLEVYDDLAPCSASYLAGLVTGGDAAAFDPRPLFNPGGMAAHPYDLAALVVPRAAGCVVEALPPGPLAVPLDTDTPVAWAGYANPAIAERLRPPDLGDRRDLSDP